MYRELEWKLVGVIHVDSGQCCIGDPCYVIAKDSSNVFGSWREFCDKAEDHEPTQEFWTNNGPGLGVLSRTGYGDGEYNVYAKIDEKGRVHEIKVVFIDNEEEERYEAECEDEDEDEDGDDS